MDLSDVSKAEAVQVPFCITLCPLTPALRQTVAIWIAHRLPDDAQLAELLFVSPETVRTYWKRIHEKLGTHNKASVLLIVLQNGWESFPSEQALQ